MLNARTDDAADIQDVIAGRDRLLDSAFDV